MSAFQPSDPRYTVSRIFTGIVVDTNPMAFLQKGSPELRVRSDDGLTAALITPHTQSKVLGPVEAFEALGSLEAGTPVQCAISELGCALWVRKLQTNAFK